MEQVQFLAAPAEAQGLLEMFSILEVPAAMPLMLTSVVPEPEAEPQDQLEMEVLADRQALVQALQVVEQRVEVGRQRQVGRLSQGRVVMDLLVPLLVLPLVRFMVVAAAGQVRQLSIQSAMACKASSL